MLHIVFLFSFLFYTRIVVNRAYKQCIENLTYGKVGRLWMYTSLVCGVGFTAYRRVLLS